MEENYLIITAKDTTKRIVMDCIFNGVQYEQIGQDVDIWAYEEDVKDICDTLTANGIIYTI